MIFTIQQHYGNCSPASYHGDHVAFERGGIENAIRTAREVCKFEGTTHAIVYDDKGVPVHEEFGDYNEFYGTQVDSVMVPLAYARLDRKIAVLKAKLNEIAHHQNDALAASAGDEILEDMNAFLEWPQDDPRNQALAYMHAAEDLEKLEAVRRLELLYVAEYTDRFGNLLSNLRKPECLDWCSRIFVEEKVA